MFRTILGSIADSLYLTLSRLINCKLRTEVGYIE